MGESCSRQTRPYINNITVVSDKTIRLSGKWTENRMEPVFCYYWDASRPWIQNNCRRDIMTNDIICPIPNFQVEYPQFSPMPIAGTTVIPVSVKVGSTRANDCTSFGGAGINVLTFPGKAVKLNYTKEMAKAASKPWPTFAPTTRVPTLSPPPTTGTRTPTSSAAALTPKMMSCVNLAVAMFLLYFFPTVDR